MQLDTLPVLLPIVGALLVVLLDVLRPQSARPVAAWIALATALLCAIALLTTDDVVAPPAHAAFRLHGLGGWFALVASLASLSAIVLLGDDPRSPVRIHRQLVGLLLVEALCIATFTAKDVWMFLFALAAAPVPMAWLIRQGTADDAAKVAVRFLTINSIANFLIIAGVCGLVVAEAEIRTNISSADVSLTSSLDDVTHGLRRLSERGELAGLLWQQSAPRILICLIIGIGIRLAIVPLHQWFVQAMARAPHPVGILLGGAWLGMGGYTALRFLPLLFAGQLSITSNVAVPWLIAAYAYAGLLALAQGDLSKKVALASVAGSQLALLGLFAVWPGATVGSSLLWLAVSVSASLAVGALAHLHNVNGSAEAEDYSGMFRQTPVWAGVFLVGMIGLTGLPGSAGFAGWLHCWFAAAENQSLIWSGSILATIAVLVAGVIVIWAMLWPIRQMLCGQPRLPRGIAHAASMIAAPNRSVGFHRHLAFSTLLPAALLAGMMAVAPMIIVDSLGESVHAVTAGEIDDASMVESDTARTRSEESDAAAGSTNTQPATWGTRSQQTAALGAALAVCGLILFFTSAAVTQVDLLAMLLGCGSLMVIGQSMSPLATVLCLVTVMLAQTLIAGPTDTEKDDIRSPGRWSNFLLAVVLLTFGHLFLLRHPPADTEGAATSLHIAASLCLLFGITLVLRLVPGGLQRLVDDTSPPANGAARLLFMLGAALTGIVALANLSSSLVAGGGTAVVVTLGVLAVGTVLVGACGAIARRTLLGSLECTLLSVVGLWTLPVLLIMLEMTFHGTRGALYDETALLAHVVTAIGWDVPAVVGLMTAALVHVAPRHDPEFQTMDRRGSRWFGIVRGLCIATCAMSLGGLLPGAGPVGRAGLISSLWQLRTTSTWVGIDEPHRIADALLVIVLVAHAILLANIARLILTGGDEQHAPPPSPPVATGGSE